MALLVKRQDELLVELKAVADEGFPRAKEEWERSVVAWGNAYLLGTEVLLTISRREEAGEEQGEFDRIS